MLVATDVAARGIHVDGIELVVHFDPPNDHKDYLHRSGRTARAGATGLVVTLAEEGQVRELQRMHDAAGVSAPATTWRRPPGRAGDRDDRHAGAARPPGGARGRPAPVATGAGRGRQRGRATARVRPAGRPGPTAAAIRRGRRRRSPRTAPGCPGPDRTPARGPARRGLRLVSAGLTLAGAA